jgi:hypothetical protein
MHDFVPEDLSTILVDPRKEVVREIQKTRVNISIDLL